MKWRGRKSFNQGRDSLQSCRAEAIYARIGSKILFLVLCLLTILPGCYREKPHLVGETTSAPSSPKITPEELFNKGQIELQKFTVPGYKKAADYFQQILSFKPDFSPAYGRLAITYALWSKERKELGLENLNQWIKASYYAEKAGELGLENESLKAQALLLNARNFLTRAEYDEIFRSTQSPARRENLEMIVFYLKDIFTSGSFKRDTIDPALEKLDQVLKNNPDDPEARIFKVWIQMATAEDENLIKTRELRPDWALPDFLLGLFLKNRGEMEEAEKCFQRVRQKNPEHPRSLAELGEIYFLKKEFQQAQEFLTEALKIDNEIPRAHWFLGLIYYEQGEYELALEHFKEVSSIALDKEEAVYYQSLILIDQERWPEAIETLTSLIELYGSYQIFGYSLRALSYLMLGKMVEAEADCREALAISSSYYLPNFILGLIFFKKEDWKRASENFVLSLKVDKSIADAHYYLGQSYLKLGALSAGEKELKRAIELFVFESGQIEEKIKQAEEKGWIKKVEFLTKRKNELEARINHCRQLLASK